VRAIICAAGSGSRLFFLTKFMNKSLLRIGGIPLLTLIVMKLKKAGIAENDINIVCLIKDFKDYSYELRDYDVRYSPFKEDMGTARHFYEANERERDYDGPILVHYGDVFTDLNYQEMINWFGTEECMIAITKNIKHDYSKVILYDDNQQVRWFEEKPLLDSYAWSGVAVFDNKRIMERIARRRQEYPFLDLAHDIFPDIVRENAMHAFVYNGEWWDVGNVRSYQYVSDKFQKEGVVKTI
jgi:NDP-sugar pyrophosphorylase family protein